MTFFKHHLCRWFSLILLKFCRQNARLKSHSFFSNFCRHNIYPSRAKRISLFSEMIYIPWIVLFPLQQWSADQFHFLNKILVDAKERSSIRENNEVTLILCRCHRVPCYCNSSFLPKPKSSNWGSLAEGETINITPCDISLPSNIGNVHGKIWNLRFLVNDDLVPKEPSLNFGHYLTVIKESFFQCGLIHNRILINSPHYSVRHQPPAIVFPSLIPTWSLIYNQTESLDK